MNKKITNQLINQLPTLLWLDDVRNPFSNNRDWLMFSPIGRNVRLFWVKSYDEAVGHIIEWGLPDAICFDHDLGEDGGDEKTGYDVAKWVVNYCVETGRELPDWNCQTANPVGKVNIDTLFNNFLTHKKREE